MLRTTPSEGYLVLTELLSKENNVLLVLLAFTTWKVMLPSPLMRAQLKSYLLHPTANKTYFGSKNYTQGFQVEHTFVIPSVEGHPHTNFKRKVIHLPNVGRCDHSWAYWMAHEFDSSVVADETDFVVFLKDTHRFQHNNINPTKLWPPRTMKRRASQQK